MLLTRFNTLMWLLWFQFCAVLGSCVPIFAFLIVQELSRSHTAALITATLLLFGES